MKRKIWTQVKHICDIPTFRMLNSFLRRSVRPLRLSGLLALAMVGGLHAQERTRDPTWLHRYVPNFPDAGVALSSPTCHFKPIFGEGGSDAGALRSISRFSEVRVDASGKCQSVSYDRDEEIYFILEGNAILIYGDDSHPMRVNDFTYLPPGVKHSIQNGSNTPVRVLVMGFKIPSTVSIAAPSPHPKVVNMDDLKEQTVEGHPTSVLYKLLLGPRTARRDAIDDAYVVTSLFLMDFAPGGTNFPHHHETAEEIYLVIDGEGEMVAGGGMDGVQGRHPAKPGDAY